MSERSGTQSPRDIVEDVLGAAMTREIWTANYDRALPLSVQDFDLTAVLPAVFYMFRFGYRRGKGHFLQTFGESQGTARQRRQSATIGRVAEVLAQEQTLFEGFDDEVTQAILGDMLLSFCLENRKRALGHQEQVQRVAPAHYMASWVDLPDKVGNLRYVPEMIVAMLADQPGEIVEQSRADKQTWFAVGQGYDNNLLLKVFHQGMSSDGFLANRTADTFDETEPVGVDQLLMIRLAQQLGAAPDKSRGRDEQISNQRPIAEQASRYFSEDIRRFVRGYGDLIPRHAFVEMLESCMAIGLTNVVLSVMDVLFEWSQTGRLPKASAQSPIEILVDCSNNLDSGLRGLSEQSMDDVMRQTERIPVVMMALRLLDQGVRGNSKLRKRITSTRPFATEWINLLGDVLYRRETEAERILDTLDDKAFRLADALTSDFPQAAMILEDDESENNPIWRMAEALTLLQGRGNTQERVIKLIDSSLLVSQPNGIAIKRKATRQDATGKRRSRDVRCLTLSDTALDYLVHLHLLPVSNRNGHRSLSLEVFLGILQERYGFCVDHAPEGMTVSNEDLQRNRQMLERRLRDLGLLVGVNDAEAMKHLVPRFQRSQEEIDDHA